MPVWKPADAIETIACYPFVIASSVGPRPSWWDDARASAACVDELTGDRPRALYIAVREAVSRDVALAVAVGVDASASVELAYIQRERVLFVGAGDHVLAYQLDPPARLWHEPLSFVDWAERDDHVAMRGRDVVVVWTARGEHCWRTPLDEYSHIGCYVAENRVMFHDVAQVWARRLSDGEAFESDGQPVALSDLRALDHFLNLRYSDQYWHNNRRAHGAELLRALSSKQWTELRAMWPKQAVHWNHQLVKLLATCEAGAAIELLIDMISRGDDDLAVMARDAAQTRLRSPTVAISADTAERLRVSLERRDMEPWW